MKNVQIKFKKTAMTVAMLALLTTQTSVFSRTIVAGPVITVDSSTLTVNAPTGDVLIKIVIRVAMPDGTVEERISNTGTVTFDTTSLADGSYRYEAWALLSNAEGKYTTENSRGSFKVSGGSIQPVPLAKPANDAEDTSFINTIQETAKTASLSVLNLLLSQAEAAPLVSSDTIPQVNFDDTSDASGSGAIDWQIRATDDAGSATFRILDDIDETGWNSETVIEIQHANVAGGGDTRNSIVIDELGNVALGDSRMFLSRFSGKMGLGTITPQAGIHAKYSGKAGLIRMEDTTNSTWEFGQFSGASASSLDGDFKIDIQANGNGGTTGTKFAIKDETGDVGIGTSSPDAKLDVIGNIHATFSGPSGNGLQQLFRMSANNSTVGTKSDAGFVMENAREGFSWAFRTDEENQGFSASKQATGAREFELINTTNVASNVELRLANGGANVNGTWVNASSRSYKKNIHELSGADAMQALRGLKSVQYQFKSDNEHKLGFIAEDVPALVATRDRKTLDPMQIVAVLTKALQEQDKTLVSKEKEIAEMRMKANKNTSRLQRLETKLEKLMLK